MSVGQVRGPGFRTTLRHPLILAVHFVILFYGVIPCLEGSPLKGTRSVWLISLLVSPPLLALLVVVLDRAGPVKNWAVALLLYLLYPAIALNHDAVVLGNYLSGGADRVM